LSTNSSPSSRLVAAVVAIGLAPLLKSSGFRKHRHHFIRTGHAGTSHLEVQSSQWNSPDRTSFTINLWTYLPAIEAARGIEPIADAGRQKLAHCGVRIGHLLPKPDDFWWLLHGEHDIERVATEVMVAVRDFGLPYLDQAATLEGVARLSGHIPGICTDPTEPKALALRLLGREQEAVVVELAIQTQREAARAYALAQMAQRSEA
jgi:hypothetical protein